MSKFINPFTDVCFMKVEDIVDIASAYAMMRASKCTVTVLLSWNLSG